MKTSVIVPAFNAELYIIDALSSALGQLASDDEVIVVDDASTDGTLAVVRALSDARVRCIALPSNVGPAAARNVGVASACGDILQFLDADDVWGAGRQAAIVQLAAASRPALITGVVEHFYCDRLPLAQRSRYQLPPTKHAVLAGTAAVRRDRFEQVGGFDTALITGEFADLVSRLSVADAAHARSDVLFLRRRIHGANHTLRAATRNEDYLAVVRAHLQRQRGQA